MKHSRILAITIAGVLTQTALARAAEPEPPKKTSPDDEPQAVEAGDKRFDLDFPGGTTVEFVRAVEKAAGRPLNVFIADEDKDFVLPALKMRQVTVPQLFRALLRISRKSENRITGYQSYQDGRRVPQFGNVTTFFGFESADNRPAENSIWYFQHSEPPELPPAQETTPSVRYWNLDRWLDKYQVEDITTAVETGWKMQGTVPSPKMSFHKDTKLLIVVGEDRQLRLVDEVLRQLQPGEPQPPARLPPAPVN